MKARTSDPGGRRKILLVLLLAGSLVPAPRPVRAEGGAAETAPAVTEGGTGASVVWDLDTVVAIALANHPLVQERSDQVAASAARKEQAESAYYPAIGLTAVYSDTRSFSSSAGRAVSDSTIAAGGRASQVLADFGRRRADVRRTDSLLSASREEGRTARNDVAFEAKVAYFDILRARRILAVGRETVSQREALLRRARAFYEAGIRAKIDVVRAEANLYQARAELTAAENELRVARITLLNRMGIDGPREYDLADAFAAEPPDGTIEDWAREAEENQPELRTVRFRLRAARHALEVARAEHFPFLTVAGEYGVAADEFPLETAHDLSFRFEIPLFTGFLTRGRVREAEADLSAERHAEIDLRRRIRLEVEARSLSMEESRERIAAREKELEASRENLRLASGRYEVGEGDIIEMIDAQVQTARADTGHIDALYDYSISVAALLRAIGR